MFRWQVYPDGNHASVGCRQLAFCGAEGTAEGKRREWCKGVVPDKLGSKCGVDGGGRVGATSKPSLRPELHSEHDEWQVRAKTKETKLMTYFAEQRIEGKSRCPAMTMV